MKEMDRKHAKERRDIIATCLRMRNLGYFVGTWGNVSARVAEGFLVTPTRIDYDAMRADDIVLMSLEGERIAGKRLPSSETELHRGFYRKFPDVNAVIHTHSAMASAMSAIRMGIPLVTEDLAQIVGGTVPCSEYVPGGHHGELGQEAMRVIGDVWAVLLANHGAICGGRSLEEATVVCQIVEKSAGIAIACLSTGREIREIAPAFVSEERDRYLKKYGSRADFAPEGRAGERA